MKFGSQHGMTVFVVEPCAMEGVKRIAGKVANDFKMVCGVLPEISPNVPTGKKEVIIFATLGSSELMRTLMDKGKFDSSGISGKREVYQIKMLENPFDGVDRALLICGSDKRGTIYGMFALSEYIGVSPLYFFGDAEPKKREEIEITDSIEIISKEPSVKYRGFFINDEWPCFGNWTNNRYGGFNSDMYDNVFELLLRLKGNYMWPAMWTSSFPLDGPGSKNEELADIYGVVMGASHHEPCLRASEEWDKVRGDGSRYGNEWNYYTNREGLLHYWEDGLKRSGKYEHVITIGMRGERDSSMLGESATLAENIDLLKDIITNQRRLIKQHVNSDISKVPQMLALYKEVEEYFYGDSETPGLKDWDGIDDVICMLCEDNFGFMRTLPTEEMRKRNGGFGMYYHFDYHGAPISYEWMPSTPYSKTWEQMCMAYEYGIRDMWIVNVGDLKFNEVPLSYFMALAYDFEKWGTSFIDSPKIYTAQWLESIFPETELQLRENMSFVLEQYINMNGMRRPEALNSTIYHPCNYLESDRMIKMAGEIEDVNEKVYSALSGAEKDAYYSMIYFPAKCSINLLRMHLYSGKNAHYAKQGKTIANEYARLVAECIEVDRALSSEFAAFKDGKWEGMELEKHIGFVKWNDDNCRYPLRILVEPADKPRLTVSRKDSEDIAVKNYGAPSVITVDDFMYEGNNEVVIEIANDGVDSFDYIITADCPIDGTGWLTVTPQNGNVAMQEDIVIRCDRSKLTEEVQTARLLIMGGEAAVALAVSGKSKKRESLPPKTFFENKGVIAIEAINYCDCKSVPGGQFTELKNYGRSGSAMKVFPFTASFSECDDKPSLTYRFYTENCGQYEIEVWLTPTNPVVYKSPIRFSLSCGEDEQILNAVPDNFLAGNPRDGRWCAGVLDQIRIVKTSACFKNGLNEITISALDPALVIERLVIYQSKHRPKPSYLGPPESSSSES